MTDDVTLDVKDLEPYIKALVSAKKKAKLAEVEAEKWKSAASNLEVVITDFMDAQGANVGVINGRHVCRYTHFTKPQFQLNKFRKAHPELKAEIAAFTDDNPQSRFTPYDDEE